MKPAPFDYQAPDTLREAIDLLASNPEAFVIAGGQSLMPVLAFRLATPSLLVDLRRLPGLGNIAVGDDGLSLGALVRWRDIEDDQRLVSAHPLLHAAVAHIGIRLCPPAMTSASGFDASRSIASRRVSGAW
jgi:carbon-monoxide dehydrogenase medium subunit